MHVGHKDLYAGFVPLACADEPCYTIAGVAHATASGMTETIVSHVKSFNHSIKLKMVRAGSGLLDIQK